MHECPRCGWPCDCDGDDMWLNPPRRCSHECDPDPYELPDMDELDDDGYMTFTQEYDDFTDADPGL